MGKKEEIRVEISNEKRKEKLCYEKRGVMRTKEDK